MRSAVIIDRDGVIFEETGHLWRIADARFLAGVRRALAVLAQHWPLFVVTNQAGIAKGIYSEKDFQNLNDWMVEQLRVSGVQLTGIYYCPHHPEGRVPEYRIHCDCRKPKIGMIRKLAWEHAIDLSLSWVIGDKTSDVETGRRAGCRTVLVRTGYGGSDHLHEVEPDFLVADLTEAARVILETR